MEYKNRYEEPTITYGQMNLIFRLRNLWRERATLTRAYMIAKTTDLDMADAIKNRLNSVALDFVNLFSLFFDEQISKQVLQFLTEQLTQTVELIDAQVAGNTTLVNEILRQIYQGADVRAEFLASINPFWNETVMKKLYYTYIQLTLQELVTLVSHEYQKNIDIYDMLLNHSDSMGDYFSQGLFNYINYIPQTNPL